ncbi:unnamed protein product [Triticum turgidum subsp. durum]|uniref:RNA-dependent RNA polymerase n=1 Tax=Triticum turgidum subsp. durum TaxID=4567 RepID=A0A9R1BDH7_TRITD|nr:unnamed protein product [Triticum turgidum subsp. durum]
MGGKTLQVSGFPATVNVHQVKDLLERIVGVGKVCAVKLRPPKNISANSRSFAIVQFETEAHASLVVNAARGNALRSGSNYLKIYKLELSYESIWEIQLHRPPGSEKEFLLIQVLAAPKIYEQNLHRSGSMYDDPLFNYFRDDTDDQWTRTTDFTPLASIGQSYILCLELPHDCDLPNIKEYFVYYKEHKRDFHCQRGHSYSSNTCFAPIVKSLYFTDVPYEILFKINHMVQNGTLSGPTLDDNFYRLDCEKLRSTDLSPRSAPGNNARRTALYNRILSVLSNGITIGNKHFEFLAFSSSQLRDNSAWMFASRPGLSASDIREWMGNFRNIRNVAKYAARLGQSFSASTETLKVHQYEAQVIPDVTNGTKYVFSDGIGTISADFADEVSKKCKLARFTPSAFQIRYGGYKGVVAINPRSHWKLSLRRSMSKFPSDNITLDVLAYSKYQPCFLNRQLITLLSTLGVRDNIFELKQQEAVKQLNRMVTEPQAAIDAIELMPMGEVTNVVKELLLCGYQPDLEPYLSMILQTFRASKLLELKTKSRIFIPEGRAMMGCLDETRTLKYGEVFIQASNSAIDSDKFVVTGKVIVAKNPCLHPGDIRILEAVYTPVLDHMVNCVVFPQQGPRQQNLISVIMFLFGTRNQQWKIKQEVHEYFANYIVNESLGIIANAHVVFADRESLKAESTPCIKLAELFSIAVDYPKTGVPAQIPPELHVKEYPDFMEKLDRATYVSEGAMGKLYREIKKQSPRIGHFTKDVARRSYDSDLIVDGYQDYIEEAVWMKGEYDFKLGNLMEHYGIKSEAEIISGCILKMAKNFTKSSDADAIRQAVKSLRKEARSWFSEMNAGESGDVPEALYAKASAWYHVTYHPEYWGCCNEGYGRPHLISFPCACCIEMNGGSKFRHCEIADNWWSGSEEKSTETTNSDSPDMISGVLVEKCNASEGGLAMP